MINADVQAALRHLAEVKDSFLAAIDTIVTLAATDMRSRCHTE